MTGRARIAGVVLAAGEGSRMGRAKAELRVDDRRLVDRAVALLHAAGCDDVVVVVRPGTSVPGARTIINDRPERGMRSSLELGVRAAVVDGDVDAIAVTLVDLPGLTVDGAATVIDAWRPGRVTVARFEDGERGHPTVMSPQLWDAAIALAGPDEGARNLIRRHRDLVDEVSCAGSSFDLDTPDDVGRWYEQRDDHRRRRIPGRPPRA